MARVEALELTDFRSYGSLSAAFPGGPQIVVGPNAAGKTNLVEALVVLALGRSHRTRSDVEMIRWEAPFARVAARTVGGRSDARTDLEVVLERQGAGVRRRVRVDGTPRRPSSLLEALRAVVFSPESMLLVAGPPVLRREALDQLAAQRYPGYARALSTYGRALAQRNSLLRALREGTAARDELPYWDGVLIEQGGAVVAWRRSLLDDLLGPLAAAHEEIAPGEGRLSLVYATNAPLLEGERPEDALRRRLTETAEREVWNGMTLVGPHRDDCTFELSGRVLAGFASRGQQRTAILAFKLAELDLLTRLDGEPPLLLLDDVFSELDPDRRHHLVRRLQGLPQAFVTTTALSDLDPGLVAKATTWAVVDGRLEPAA